MRPVLTARELSETAVSEEASEVNIELSKAKRFGWLAPNIYDGTTPAGRMAEEIGDLLGSIDFFLDSHPEFDEELLAVIAHRRSTKRAKLVFWNNPENHEKRIEIECPHLL